MRLILCLQGASGCEDSHTRKNGTVAVSAEKQTHVEYHDFLDGAELLAFLREVISDISDEGGISLGVWHNHDATRVTGKEKYRSIVPGTSNSLGSKRFLRMTILSSFRTLLSDCLSHQPSNLRKKDRESPVAEWLGKDADTAHTHTHTAHTFPEGSLSSSSLSSSSS